MEETLRICPHCQSSNVEIMGSMPDGTNLNLLMLCNFCHKTFKELN